MSDVTMFILMAGVFAVTLITAITIMRDISAD